MIDDLRSLRAFVATAEELNFRRAAERLHISQPPLSRMIAGLEDTLETKLFERSTRQVALTPAGETLYREARSLLAKADEVARMLKREISIRRGFAIGCTSAAYCTHFPQIVARLRELHPEIEVSLHEMNTSAQIEKIAAAKLDAGILLLPAEDRCLEVLPFASIRMRLAVPSNHRLAGSREAVSLEEFAKDIFIVHSREENPAMYHEILHHCSKAGFRPRTITKQKGQNCMALVASGAGVHFTAGHRQCLSIEGVDFLELAGDAPILEMGIGWRKHERPPVIESLLELLPSGA